MATRLKTPANAETVGEIAVIEQRPLDVYRQSTDAANVCKEIVVATSSNIQGRRYVAVEGWQAIAVAHGCVASAIDVRRITDEGATGFAATGVLRRMSDGVEIGRAEGFVGDDERTWGKRDVYAKRAMAQTRAISRVCRSAFAHVVVMMKAGLATTPAEEVPHDPHTGEIIEASSGPAPRTKLEGPYTSKTALKTAIHSIASAVIKAKEIKEIDAALKAGKPAIQQAERDWPELLTGDPKLEGDDEGLKRLVARRREELTKSEGESLLYQLLVSTLNECASLNELNAWMKREGDQIDQLDGEESRAFENLYNEKEAALKLAATVRA